MATQVNQKENKAALAQSNMGAANSIANLRDNVVANLIQAVLDLQAEVKKLKGEE